MSEFILPASDKRGVALAKVCSFLRRLGPEVPWKVTVELYKKRRSNQQNAYLWGAVYPTILKEAGLEGWTADDLHEYFLGENFGWETLEGLGRKRVRPIRRSSKLKTTEFSDYVAFIQQTCAEKFGIYIPDPDEEPTPVDYERLPIG